MLRRTSTERPAMWKARFSEPGIVAPVTGIWDSLLRQSHQAFVESFTSRVYSHHII